VSADPVLAKLLAELVAYPMAHSSRPHPPVREPEQASVVVPLQLTTERGTLSFLSTTTVFGTPLDITLSELALETFFPADKATAVSLRALSDAVA
jgi:hypothetical protein